jgi:uncharacterized membrane protein (DUF4010 family)
VESNPIHALVVSGSLGALIGLVRQWEYEKKHPGEESPAGLRTFTIWGLLGCAAAELDQAGATLTFPVALAVFTLVLGAIHLREQAREQLGLTTFSVGLITFIAGGMAAYQHYQVALVLGAAAMLVLGTKDWSHSWTRRLTSEDLHYFLQFVAITGLVLPLAPDENMGPYGAFNPFKIWLMVVLVMGLGFAGYVAVRWLGERAGITVTGLAGGLASSTVTTLALGRQSASAPALAGSLAFAAVLASTVMNPRGVVMVALISPDTARLIIAPFLLMMAPGVLWLLWEWRRQRAQGAGDVATPALPNPLSLRLAVKFGLLYAFIALVVKVSAQQLSSEWVYVVSFVSGLTDINAITVTSAQAAASHTLTPVVAARCVLLGSLANTLLKGVLAAGLGAPVYRRTTALALAAMFVAGAAGWWLI